MAPSLKGLFGGGSEFPSERDWEKSVLLTPRPAGYDPELVSDGGGLPFAPGVFDDPAGELNEQDPAVQALVALLARQKTQDGTPVPAGLGGWRLLARAEKEALFGYGLPPDVMTVVMDIKSRRQGWGSRTVTKKATLRSLRDGIRASSWRPDPSRGSEPGDTVLRILIREQTRSGGMRADGRLLAPDLHLGDEELVLTTYVTPRGGIQTYGTNPETPARVLLPEPLGDRYVIDGAVFEPEGD